MQICILKRSSPVYIYICDVFQYVALFAIDSLLQPMFDMVIVAFCRWQGKVVDWEGGGKEIEDSDQIDGAA